LIDFGVATTGLDGPHPAAVIGSPSYMAPEQMQSPQAADTRSDIWSLGIILYELVSGCVPFTADSLPTLAARVLLASAPPLPGPPDPVRAAFAEVIHRCLAKDPAARFQTVGELATALAPFGSPAACEAAEQVARVLGSPLPPEVATRGPAPRSSSTRF